MPNHIHIYHNKDALELFSEPKKEELRNACSPGVAINTASILLAISHGRVL